MLESAYGFLEEGNERMAEGVANKNMNEIEATQKIIELAQEKQKKAKHELETVHKEKQKFYIFKLTKDNTLSMILLYFYCYYPSNSLQ